MNWLRLLVAENGDVTVLAVLLAVVIVAVAGFYGSWREQHPPKWPKQDGQG